VEKLTGKLNAFGYLYSAQWRNGKNNRLGLGLE